MNIKKSTVQNIDKWGNDKDHNILYVTGFSGSGKSTTASQINDQETIHLDLYLEPQNHGAYGTNKQFTNFIKENYPDFYKNIKSNDRKDRWRAYDDLEDAINKYGQKQYGSNRVIVEGVQISDDTLYPNKKFFHDKPLMIINTNGLKAIKRAWERDGKNFDEKDLEEAKQWINYMQMNRKKMLNQNNITKGSLYINYLLNS